MVLCCRLLSHHYIQASEKITILKDINLTVTSGEIVGLVGASGSGKSTLLHILGLLDKAISGTVTIDDDSFTIDTFNNHKATLVRRHKVGFIYQFHHLLPQFTALENVLMPLYTQGNFSKKSHEKAIHLFNKLKLQDRLHNLPSQLSGGEQQRVAIARALIHEPKVILADEPTGNLDTDTAKNVFHEFLQLSKEFGVATLIATHDLSLAQKMDRIVKLENGTLSIVELTS